MNNPPAPLPPLDEATRRRRNRFARLSSAGKRVGYGLFGLSCVACAVGLATRFSNGSGWLMVATLLAGSAVLLPSIIFGYAVKAAERHDLGLSDGH